MTDQTSCPDARDGSNDRHATGWRVHGSDERLLSASEARAELINRITAGQLSMMLESDTDLTLHLVTNRFRVMVMLTGPGDSAGHAIDPDATGTSDGYLLDNGQEDEYADRDTVSIPDALGMIDHILAHGAPPQNRWSIDVPG